MACREEEHIILSDFESEKKKMKMSSGEEGFQQKIPCDLDFSPEKSIEEEEEESYSDYEINQDMIFTPGICSSDEEAPEDHMEVYEEYERQVVASGGFDIDYCPNLLRCSLTPVKYLSEERVHSLRHMSNLAIHQFNTDYATKYSSVEFVKANWVPCSGGKYYITFEAKEPSDDASTIFQALVYQGIPKSDGTQVFKVKLVRKKSWATEKDNDILLGC